MKLGKRIFQVTTLIALFLAAGFANESMAQSKEEAYNTYKGAVEVYNRGLAQADSAMFDQAIASFSQAVSLSQQAIDICNNLSGDECVFETEGGSETNIISSAEGIMDKANNNMPRLYYQKAATLYKNKEYMKAIDTFKDAESKAAEVGDDQIERRANTNIYKLYYSLGNSYLKNKQFDQALEYFDKSLEVNPENAKVYYHKGIVYKQKEMPEKALEMYDKAIQMALSTNDSVTERRASNAARDYLVFRGSNLIKSKNYQLAIQNLEKALEYDNESADAYYRLSEAYNKQAMWDLAIEHANKALKYEKGSKTDRAKIYFELGMALKEKGNKGGACDAFENAAYGSFKNAADHQIQHELKCDQLNRSN